jgi:hypothetical protein
MLLSEICGIISVGRPLWREDGSAICSVITQWSESRRTRNHTLILYPSFIWHGPQRKQRLQQSFVTQRHMNPAILLMLHVFFAVGICSPSRSLATKGWIFLTEPMTTNDRRDLHTDRRKVIMKYTADINSGVVIYTPSFTSFENSKVNGFWGRGGRFHRQHANRISLCVGNETTYTLCKSVHFRVS